ncbi:MAG: hypothetical protein FWB98_00290 [Defluviitaleaceae bacterium]|nr:hypothetical protein [Defluviitaleaceae bacterium]
MKRLKLVAILCLVAATFVGCGLLPREDEAEVGYYRILQSLTGVWTTEDGALSLSIYEDGTWEHSFGDMSLSGNVQVSEHSEGFALELVITYISGPGAPYSDWLSGDLWGRGTYSSASSHIHLERHDGSTLRRGGY